MESGDLVTAPILGTFRRKSQKEDRIIIVQHHDITKLYEDCHIGH